MRLDVMSRRPQDGEPAWKTVDEWFQSYWTGLDARFYAGNILLDELLSLQWELQESVLPLFGYADYTMRRAVHGVRRVQGAFQMNFKREGYLFEVLRSLANPQLTGATGKTAGGENLPAWRLARTGKATVEDFVALVTPDPVKPVRSGSGSKLDKTAASAARLKSVTSAFEDAIWGNLPEKAPQAAQGAAKFLSPDRARFALQDSFDLGVQFGSVSDEELKERQAIARAQGLHVESAPVQIPVTTTTRIVGIELTGRQTVLDDSGRPVIETYSFLAKDVL